jgi:hypothetical protein
MEIQIVLADLSFPDLGADDEFFQQSESAFFLRLGLLQNPDGDPVLVDPELSEQLRTVPCGVDDDFEFCLPTSNTLEQIDLGTAVALQALGYDSKVPQHASST